LCKDFYRISSISQEFAFNKFYMIYKIINKTNAAIYKKIVPII